MVFRGPRLARRIFSFGTWTPQRENLSGGSVDYRGVGVTAKFVRHGGRAGRVTEPAEAAESFCGNTEDIYVGGCGALLVGVGEGISTASKPGEAEKLVDIFILRIIAIVRRGAGSQKEEGQSPATGHARGAALEAAALSFVEIERVFGNRYWERGIVSNCDWDGVRMERKGGGGGGDGGRWEDGFATGKLAECAGEWSRGI
ncbi:hypothetical protein Tco_0645883 [Tanacetum coccineum]